MGETILMMEGIYKQFDGVYALKNARFDLKSGEIHALMGENGAGKSTLMKILTGIYEKDEGTVELFGKKADFTNIRQSRDAGIGMIHQELNMMNHLTVAQNIYIGREPMKGRGIIDDRKMERDAAALFEHIGVDISPEIRLGRLTVGKQQMVEIAKAISHESKILILDEPTAALTQTEVEELFAIMRDLRAKGIGMIYISHRMDEIKRISDRVTIMRDGEYVGTVNTAETTNEEIIKMMVGRVIYGELKEASTCPADAPTVLRVENLNCGSMVKDVSFHLKKGEILGFSGLMGAGRTETMRAVCGADRRESGDIEVNGRRVNIRDPHDAIKHGICYLSEDRKQYGLLLNKSVTSNTVLASLGDFVRHGFLDDKKIADAAVEYSSRLDTKTKSLSQPVKNLSGGNQQKVIVARWLLKNSDIIIFDEPTRGIDVGVKSEMYRLMEDLVKDGKSIIIISSELQELRRLCDRIVVMCEGRITGELDIGCATEENIMKLATQR